MNSSVKQPKSLSIRTAGLLLALLACVGIGASSAGAAVTAKGVNGYFGATGEAGGQLNTPRGTAVNQTNGNVYVADSANNRISVFNSSGTFLRAFGQDVVASGPDDNGIGYEICVAADGDVCKAGITTASTGGAMQAPQGVALDASGNVYVSEQNKLRVQKFDAEGHFLLAFGRNVVESGPDDGPATAEVQSLKIAAAAGTFTLTFSGQTTSALQFDASAEEVETALDELSSIGGEGGSVRVSGGPGDGAGSSPYVVTFGGDLNGVNVPQITLDQTNLQLAVGTTLTCTAGPAGATSLTYQWLRNGTPIAGASSAGYTTAVADEGKSLQCQTFAINSNAGATAISPPFTVASPATAPPIPATPKITGGFLLGAKEGETLTCNPGTWSGSPTIFTYQWYSKGAAVSGATNSTYVVQVGDLRGNLQCVVSGANAGGAAVAASANEKTSPAASPAAPVATATVASPTAATTTTEGSSVTEACIAAAGDVCQAGVAGTAGGEFGSTFDGYLTIAPADAVNAGNVLVADPANRRVQEFTPAGAFVRAFGFDVKIGGVTTFEVCEVAAECKEGASGAGVGQFATNTPTRVAEDAEGDIYTVEPTGNFRVQKFTLPGNVVTPQGNFSEANTKGTSTTAPSDVAIDPATKDVLVTKAFAAGATPSCPNTGVASVAERRVLELSQAGALEATHMACAGINVANGLAMRSSASSGDVYVASATAESRLYVLNTPLPAPTVTFQGITELSAHGATVSGFVDPNGPASLPYGLTTSYHVAFKRSVDPTFTNAPPIDVNLGKGTTNQFVSQQLSGLEAGTTYEVQIVAGRLFGAGKATTAIFSFTTPAAAPEVTVPGVTTAATGTGAKAALWGSVNPNGQPTTYHFEYGTTPAYGTSIPASDAAVGSGFSYVPANQFVEGLQADTTYHFRIVASNATGVTSSPDVSVTTPPTGGGLPADRGIELVSPSNKHPVGRVGGLQPQLEFHAAEDGESVSFAIENALEDSDAGGSAIFNARRSAAGWQSTEITPPSLIPPSEEGQGTASTGLVNYISPDNGCAVVQSAQPLTADTPAVDVENGVYNLYRWERATDAYTLITNRPPLDPTKKFGGGTTLHYTVLGASADCARVFFEPAVSGGTGRIYSFISSGDSGLYEWDEGTLRDAGLRPDGSVAGGLIANDGVNVVSPDGHFFFTATSDAGNDSGQAAIFVRNSSTEVIDASLSQTTIPSAGARYQAASPDGSSVFFLANYGLAATSSAGPTTEACPASGPWRPRDQACDLYRYDVDTGRLVDVSADPNPADPVGAATQGVLAVSGDGSVVYFAARGQLVPGQGRTYSQDQAGSGFANVYRWQAGRLSYVGSLTEEDIETNPSRALIDTPRGAAGGGGTSQTTGSGEYLLFTSHDDITGTNPAEVAQAYLYTASSESLNCISCPTGGGQPIGGGVEGKLVSTAVFPIVRYELRNLARVPDTPRSLSEDGRAIFTAEDALAPGAIAGQGSTGDDEKNIYEWHDGQVALLVSGAVVMEGMGGPGGRDVFIKAFGQLNRHDTDFAPDLYDFRSGGGFAEPPPAPQPCDAVSGACQGSPPSPPGSVQPPTAASNGPGNPPAPKQKPKKHKKKHNKHNKHKKKHSKKDHKAKRATNGNRGGAK